MKNENQFDFDGFIHSESENISETIDFDGSIANETEAVSQHHSQEETLQPPVIASSSSESDNSKNLDTKAELKDDFEEVLNLIHTKNDKIFVKSMLSRMKATLLATKIGGGPSANKMNVKNILRSEKVNSRYVDFERLRKDQVKKIFPKKKLIMLK